MKLIVKIIVLLIYIFLASFIAFKRDNGSTWKQIFMELLEAARKMIISSLPAIVYVVGIVLILLS